MLDHELAMRLRRLCNRDNWMLCQNLTLFVSVSPLSHTHSLSLSLSRAQPLNKHPHSSYYLTTITGRVPIETLKEEYSHFVPDVSIFTSSTLLYVITVCVREPVSHSQVVLPMEWVYGVMFRACEEQENLGFALELWNREGMRE